MRSCSTEPPYRPIDLGIGNLLHPSPLHANPRRGYPPTVWRNPVRTLFYENQSLGGVRPLARSWAGVTGNALRLCHGLQY